MICKTIKDWQEHWYVTITCNSFIANFYFTLKPNCESLSKQIAQTTESSERTDSKLGL